LLFLRALLVLRAGKAIPVTADKLLRFEEVAEISIEDRRQFYEKHVTL
jgi:hypothetical protein